MKSIFELLPLVMGDIGNISKENQNSFQKYRFRGIDDVLNHVGPSLTKHGVSLSVEVVDHKLIEVQTEKGYRVTASLRMKVSFIAPDQSRIENVTAGEASDTNGDKATNKAMAAAFKYACFYGLCIPVEPSAVDDSDRDAPGDPMDAAVSAVKKEFDATTLPPITPEQKERMFELADQLGYDDATLSKGIAHHSQGAATKADQLCEKDAAVVLSALSQAYDKACGQDTLPGIPGN